MNHLVGRIRASPLHRRINNQKGGGWQSVRKPWTGYDILEWAQYRNGTVTWDVVGHISQSIVKFRTYRILMNYFIRVSPCESMKMALLVLDESSIDVSNQFCGDGNTWDSWRRWSGLTCYLVDINWDCDLQVVQLTLERAMVVWKREWGAGVTLYA
jgi:hypothetical protein